MDRRPVRGRLLPPPVLLRRTFSAASEHARKPNNRARFVQVLANWTMRADYELDHAVRNRQLLADDYSGNRAVVRDEVRGWIGYPNSVDLGRRVSVVSSAMLEAVCGCLSGRQSNQALHPYLRGANGSWAAFIHTTGRRREASTARTSWPIQVLLRERCERRERVTPASRATNGMILLRTFFCERPTQRGAA